MAFHVPETCRETSGRMRSTSQDGNNGAFLLPSPLKTRQLWSVASDGDGWEHVSVSVRNWPDATPTWEEMHFVKTLFWDAEDTVMQLHPPASTYRNWHPGCLHMWRPTKEAIPLPPPIMVAPES